MMKIVVRETEARKASGGGLHTPITRYRNIVAGGAHCNTCASVGPIRVQNLKAIGALESGVQPLSPFALGPMGKQKYHNCGPGRARTMIIFTPE